MTEFSKFISDNRDLLYMALAIIYLVVDRMVRKTEKTEANSITELVESGLVKALSPKQPKE